MTNDEFEQRVSEFNEFWNTKIVSQYEILCTHLKKGPSRDHPKINHCLTLYTELIQKFIDEMSRFFKSYPLNDQQNKRLTDYLTECQETGSSDLEEMTPLYQTHCNPLLPTLEEQALTNEIFPYYSERYLNFNGDEQPETPLSPPSYR